MKVKVIEVPYDSGYKDIRQGLGPAFFLQKGLEGRLAKQGHLVEKVRIETESDFTTETSTAFELNRLLANRVRAAVRENAFPLILSGNCNSCLGAIAGLGSDKPGIVWFDAHGEFNTPETTGSGWLDGMPLAMATGRCWKTLLETIPGFKPAIEENIVLIGARDLDPKEEASLNQSGLTLVRTNDIEESRLLETIDTALDALQRRVEGVYIHIDMDSFDLDGRQANHLHPPGGLKPDVFQEVIMHIKKRFPVRAATVASYDPEVDVDGAGYEAVVRIIGKILESTT